ncbi:MAG TPA: PEP-CTERM sorting domain-containing protein, partial [Gemmataceae bacterium]|nr:PEP-CTERM sorting domain-containing protein [Gemmataceae bacterium]
MRLKWLLTLAAGLVCAVSARADTLTLTSGTVDGKTPINQFNSTALSGFSYTNAIASGNLGTTVQVGDAINEVGFVVVPQSSALQFVGNGSLPQSTTLSPQIIAVFAVHGTVTNTVGGTLQASITSGSLALLQGVNGGTFRANDPTTWIAGGTLVQGWTIHNVPGGTNTVSAPNNTLSGGPGVSQPASGNNVGVANLLSPFNSDTNVVFDNKAGNFIPFNGLQVDLGERLVDPGAPGGALNTADADALSIALTGQTFTGPGTGGQFAPGYGISGTILSGSTANGDTIQSAGSTAWFGNFPAVTTTTGAVPEPASMLLWGLGALGVG